MSADFIDPYLIPGTNVLKNSLGIIDTEKLAAAEYDITLFRRQQLAREEVSEDFDLSHLRAVHRHLFQDIFPWAGELRTVDITKQGSQFAPVSTIQTGSDFTFQELHHGPLLGKAPIPDEEFVNHISTLLERINYLHPFREGNGRTQRAFLDQVAAESGRTLSWRNVGEHDHIRAAIEAFDMGTGEPYKRIFVQLLKTPRDGLSLLDDGLYRASAPTGSQEPGKYAGRSWATAGTGECGKPTSKGHPCKRRGQCPHHGK